MPTLPVGGDVELPAQAGAAACVDINLRTQDQTFPDGASVVVEDVAVTGENHIGAGGSSCADQGTVSCDGFVFEDASDSCGADVEVLAGAVAGEEGNIELSGRMDCSRASELESCLAVGEALNVEPPTGTVTLFEPDPPEPVG